MATFIKDIEEIRDRARHKIEEGAVTESYQLDKDRAVDILNEALATEIVCVLRYLHHYFMATGIHGRAVAEEFKEHADDEREHADEIAERIQQLGGKPDFNPGSLLQRSVAQYVEGESLADMIREDLVAERTVIDVYQRMIEFFGLKDPTTRALLEHIKAEEEEHASDLSDFLYIVDPKTGETAGQDPGARPLDIAHSNQSQSKQANQDQSKRAQDSVSRDMVASSENALEEMDSRSGGRSNQSLRRSGSTESRGDDMFPEAPVEEALSGLDRPSSSPAPAQQSKSRQGNARPEPKTQAGNKRPPTSEPQRGATKRNEREPFAGRGTVEAPASNLPGVSGRTMNRRRNVDEIDETEVAERSNAGGSRGTNRSPRIMNKTRKKRAA